MSFDHSLSISVDQSSLVDQLLLYVSLFKIPVISLINPPSSYRDICVRQFYSTVATRIEQSIWASETTVSLTLTSSRWPSCTTFCSSSYQLVFFVHIEHRSSRLLTTLRISTVTRSSALGTLDWKQRWQSKRTFFESWKIYFCPSTKRLKTNGLVVVKDYGMFRFKWSHISSFSQSFSLSAYFCGRCLKSTRKIQTRRVSGSSYISLLLLIRRFSSAQLSSLGYQSKFEFMCEKFLLRTNRRTHDA